MWPGLDIAVLVGLDIGAALGGFQILGQVRQALARGRVEQTQHEGVIASAPACHSSARSPLDTMCVGGVEMTDYDPTLVGRVFEANHPIRITAEMIASFCVAVGETSPLYTDSEAAKNGPWGGPVAPPSIIAAFGADDNVLRLISFGWPAACRRDGRRVRRPDSRR